MYYAIRIPYIQLLPNPSMMATRLGFVSFYNAIGALLDAVQVLEDVPAALLVMVEDAKRRYEVLNQILQESKIDYICVFDHFGGAGKGVRSIQNHFKEKGVEDERHKSFYEVITDNNMQLNTFRDLYQGRVKLRDGEDIPSGWECCRRDFVIQRVVPLSWTDWRSELLGLVGNIDHTTRTLQEPLSRILEYTIDIEMTICFQREILDMLRLTHSCPCCRRAFDSRERLLHHCRNQKDKIHQRLLPKAKMRAETYTKCLGTQIDFGQIAETKLFLVNHYFERAQPVDSKLLNALLETG
jgi:hypothetical protein